MPGVDELADRGDQALALVFLLVAAAGREQDHRRAPVAVHDDAQLAAKPVRIPAMMFAAHMMASPNAVSGAYEYNLTILCIATYFKGEPFLRECQARAAPCCC